ncbi:unnamed protein product [Calypogeia fissa]
MASQRLALKSFWLHPTLKHLHPSEYGDPKLDATVKACLEDTKQTLQMVKGAQRKDHLSAKQPILVGMAGKSVAEAKYQTALSKALGIKKTNVFKATRKRARIDADMSEKFPMGIKKPRKDRISKEVREYVQMYWEVNTKVSSIAKDQARKRLARKFYAVHRIHLLEETEAEFYLRFKEGCESNGETVPVGLRMFQYLKPYFIRTMKDRHVCCCKHHVEMDLLKQALNKYRVHFHPHIMCKCPCAICNPQNDDSRLSCCAGKATITSVREWCEEILCPKQPGRPWYNKECIMGNCASCGVPQLRICGAEIDSKQENLIKWESFQYVSMDKTGKKKNKDNTEEPELVRRIRQVEKETTMAIFMEKVKSTMPKFVIHNFQYRWQVEEYKRCLALFPKRVIMSSIDFSKNYTFQVQNEIQSMHWDNRQISILVHAAFRHRDNSLEEIQGCVGTTLNGQGSTVEVQESQSDTEVPDRDVVTDYHFYISDDNTHDTLFVQHCLDKHAKWMEDEGIQQQKHMDGEGGSVKAALAKEQLKGSAGHKLQNAHDAVKFLRSRFALGKDKEYGEVQSGAWMTKSGCPNEEYVGQWMLKTIHPKQASSTGHAASIDSEAGEGLEEWEDEDGDLADLIGMGDYFAVLANEESEVQEPFWVLQYTKGVHICTKTFTDSWDNLLIEGEKILEGIWYQQYGRSNTRYVKKDDSPSSFVHASGVFHIGFAFHPAGKSGQDDAFKMTQDTYEAIIQSLTSPSVEG